MRRRKTRNSLFHVFWAVPALAAALFAYQGATKPDKAEKKKGTAVVAGTVFRDPGFAQAGATVAIARKEQPGKKLHQETSNYRGEFSFRVPAGPETYVLTAALKGFKPERQEIQVSGEEQVNATLVLVPESKR